VRHRDRARDLGAVELHHPIESAAVERHAMACEVLADDPQVVHDEIDGADAVAETGAVAGPAPAERNPRVDVEQRRRAFDVQPARLRLAPRATAEGEAAAIALPAGLAALESEAPARRVGEAPGGVDAAVGRELEAELEGASRRCGLAERRRHVHREAFELRGNADLERRPLLEPGLRE